MEQNATKISMEKRIDAAEMSYKTISDKQKRLSNEAKLATETSKL